MRFIDLFAGLGGFHLALARLGHECVFASELDSELRDLYLLNFPEMKGRVHGDIRRSEVLESVPPHDILCAGFPCQPFSKSGAQKGTRDETRGTLFHEIIAVLEKHKPQYVLLENVGNFGRHDGGRTWRIVRQQLEHIGYEVRGTEHITPQALFDWRDVGAMLQPKRKPSDQRKWDGHGLISPHHFGFPQHRERFFIVGALDGLPVPAFPTLDRTVRTSLEGVVLPRDALSKTEIQETRLTAQQRACIRHWNELLRALPKHVELPSFPIWGDELTAKYPFERRSPWGTSLAELGRSLGLGKRKRKLRKKELLLKLPNYAREEVLKFRHWKIRYIKKNREWWAKVKPHLPNGWAQRLRQFPPSLRKLEWNAKGGQRNLWRYVLQFRPSGLRAKRYVSSPALVAMTSTQIPILGPQKRFIARSEALLLQGFSKQHRLPKRRDDAFKALGNAVHVGVVERIAAQILSAQRSSHVPELADRDGAFRDKKELRRQ